MGLNQTMLTARWQAVLVVSAGVLIGELAQAQPQGRYAQQLARECDALIAVAVKRPYGWGWSATLAHDPKDRMIDVEMRPPGTPAAGLVLLWAGALLEEPRFTEAGINAARGVAAAQTTNGNVLSAPTFGPRIAGREPPSNVPDRAATRAGMALLLAAIGMDSARDDLFRRSALRASLWLSKQQASDGSWPSPAPSGAATDLPLRLIRLESPDFRDSTFAMLLAADVTQDKRAARSAAAAIDKLVSLQLTGPGKLGGTWAAYYRMDGSLEERVEGSPAGADALASRRAVEVLLAAAVLTEYADAATTAREAARALSNLRDADGTWRRLHPLRGEVDGAADSTFGTSTTDPAPDPAASGDFGIPDVLGASDQLRILSRPAFAKMLSDSATIQERLATTICGLTDLPFALGPRDAGQIPEFLQHSEGQFRQVNGPAPASLNERVTRLYALLLLARLEAQFGEIDN